MAGVQDGDLLVSFDITNMFPSINNQNVFSVERVQRKLYEYASSFDIPVECIIEAMEICLRRNCSTYCGQFCYKKTVQLWALKILAHMLIS